MVLLLWVRCPEEIVCLFFLLQFFFCCCFLILRKLSRKGVKPHLKVIQTSTLGTIDYYFSKQALWKSATLSAVFTADVTQVGSLDLLPGERLQPYPLLPKYLELS